MAATPDRCRARGSPWGTTRPNASITPASGATAPVMILTSVDLPAAFSPTRPCTSPASRSKSTSRRARTPGYAFWIPCARSTTCGITTSATLPGSARVSVTWPTPPPAVGCGRRCGCAEEALVIRVEAARVGLGDVEGPEPGHLGHVGLVDVAVHRLALQSHDQRDRRVVGLLERQEDLRVVPGPLLDPLDAGLRCPGGVDAHLLARCLARGHDRRLRSPGHVVPRRDDEIE